MFLRVDEILMKMKSDRREEAKMRKRASSYSVQEFVHLIKNE
jgi:hypothetical protein